MNTTWTRFLRGILRIPGAKVNREEFLRTSFNKAPVYITDRIVELGPQAVMTPESIARKAQSIIRNHTLTASAISAASGIPGGLGMLATIPADLANYYYHVVNVGQKLGYLYGWPDMLDEDENLTEQGEIALTAFIAVMNKMTMAQELIKLVAEETAKRISGKTATKVAGKLLSKQIVSQMAEAVAERLGHRITAKTGGKFITRAVPVLSGVLCGTITYVTFRKQALRLQRELQAGAC